MHGIYIKFCGNTENIPSKAPLLANFEIKKLKEKPNVKPFTIFKIKITGIPTIVIPKIPYAKMNNPLFLIACTNIALLFISSPATDCNMMLI